MNTRFYNARILTMESGIAIKYGELWVKNNIIYFLGDIEKSPAPLFWDQEIDCKSNLLMPGFKNAHTHSSMTFLRSYADDLPLSEWLNKQVFPMEAKLKPEDIYHLSKLAIMEYLTSGITANFDMYFYPDMNAKASVDTGFRTVLMSGISNFNSSTKELESEYITYNHYHDLISYRLGFHAEYTASKELLQSISSIAHRYKAPVFTHNSESISEVESCIKATGMTPTEYMDSLGLFEYGGGGFHCIHLSDNDMKIFKSRGMYAVTNPGSNMKLASGIAPLQQMKSLGIPLAIGTDGAASNNCLDMFREMFLASGLQKLKYDDASAMNAEDVLYMATVGGAKAMGLDNCDILKKGRLADLILIDLNQPNMQPLNNIAKNLVYSGSKINVKLTMIDGKILYHDGVFNIGINPDEVYFEANKCINRMKNQ